MRTSYPKIQFLLLCVLTLVSCQPKGPQNTQEIMQLSADLATVKTALEGSATLNQTISTKLSSLEEQQKTLLDKIDDLTAQNAAMKKTLDDIIASAAQQANPSALEAPAIERVPESPPSSPKPRPQPASKPDGVLERIE